MNTPDPLSANSPAVLVGDGSPTDTQRTVAVVEKQLHAQAAVAATAAELLDALGRHSPGALLLDVLFLNTAGLKLVDTIRTRYPHLPIVLLISPGTEALALEALTRGAATYVPKKSLETDLADTLEQVLSTSQRHGQQQRLQDCVTRLEYHFVLENDRTLIPPLVHFLQDHLSRLQICDETNRIRVGVALEEALLNAMYHGNLECPSDLRQDSDESYLRLAEERSTQEPWSRRRIHFETVVTRTEATFIVRDEGPGFRPGQLPDPTDPANLEKISGRGLLLIQKFMDEVRYNQRGNEIVMIKRRTSAPQKPGPPS